MVVVCKYMVHWCECVLVVCMSVVECLGLYTYRYCECMLVVCRYVGGE